MATGNVKLSVIDVGQGQCTFVEIYDQSATPVLTNTLLLDCGTNKESDCTTVNLQYVATKAAGKNPPGFDCIFFSHSDTDHTNRARFVLEEVEKKITPTILQIGQVWYAGAHQNYTKGSDRFNILDYIVAKKYCSSANMGALESNYTGYSAKKNAFEVHLWKTPDDSVHIYPIVANALSEDPDWTENDEDVSGTTPEAKNMISLICGLYYAGASYVICGDATNSTMGAVTNLFPKKTALFDNNKMSTLPHHGSRRTGLAVAKGAPANDKAIKVVKTFAALLKSRFLTDSAYEKHRHPSLELMNLFIPQRTTPLICDPRLKQKDSHCLHASIDIDISTGTGKPLTGFIFAITFDTLTNTFTTRYYGVLLYSYNLGDKQATSSKGVEAGQVINPFACWAFITDTSGEAQIDGYANMNSPDFTEDASDIQEQAAGRSHAVIPFRVLPRPPAVRQSQFHHRIQTFR